jgi:hypothetical protein
MIPFFDFYLRPHQDVEKTAGRTLLDQVAAAAVHIFKPCFPPAHSCDACPESA